MKKITTAILLSFSFLCNAQTEFGKFNYHGLPNFNLIKIKADSFFSNNLSNGIDKKDVEEDNDYFRYKRWEWFWKDRVNADGSFPDLLKQSILYNHLKTANRSKALTVASPWVNISQTSAIGGYEGMGRITSVAFHPTNPDIFWVGAPIGGIWKTTDGGLTYSSLGDNLPYCSVGNILVDYTNPDIIYITIGDNIGWWNAGLGVYKSIDGGITWAPTTLVSDFPSSIAYYKMVMSPDDHNTILLGSTNGLYRTADGGATWSLINSGEYNDIVFRQGDGATVYTSSNDYWGSSEVFKSTDSGATFFPITSFFTHYNSIHLSVTPADQDILGIMLSGSGMKKYYNSTDNGATINFVSDLPEDATIFISPVNPNQVYAGNLNIYSSSDAGVTWSQLTNWYGDGIHKELHADQHFVASNPLNNKIYFCNDGGINSLDESTNTWAELNSGLIITQFYSIAVSQSDPVFMIGGTQDNGGRKRTSVSNWEATNGGDAMVTAIDETNDQTIYTTYYGGTLYRSYDQWTSDVYNEITPVGVTGSWVTPYVLNPGNQSTIIAGYEDVYKSVDQGNTWNKISDNLTGSVDEKLRTIAVAPTDSNVIYTSKGATLYSTINGGTDWASHTLPVANDITSISIDPLHSNNLIVTIGGYISGKKVYKSVNSGTSWTNISDTLPNVPVSTSIYDKTSPTHELYIGTDVGVFYMNDLVSSWTYIGSELPNTAVSDLKIQYNVHKLRAATYGRGIWETDLMSSLSTEGLTTNTPVSQRNNFSVAFNPVNNTIYLNSAINKDVNCQLKMFDYVGKLLFKENIHFQEGNYQVPVDASGLPQGMYLMLIESTEGNTTIKIVKAGTN